MKQIDKYFFDDNFAFTNETLYGVNIFSDGKHIYADKQTMLYVNAVGRVCEKCGNMTSATYNIYCDKCENAIKLENYLKLEVALETKHLYSDYLDEFFDTDDWDCIYDHLSNLSHDEILNFDFATFRIHPCKDSYAQTIDIADYFEEAPEGFDLDSYKHIEEINTHVNKVNELILSEPTGYEPIMSKRFEIDKEEWSNMKKALIEDLENDLRNT